MLKATLSTGETVLAQIGEIADSMGLRTTQLPRRKFIGAASGAVFCRAPFEPLCLES